MRGTLLSDIESANDETLMVSVVLPSIRRWAENPFSVPCVEVRERIPAGRGCEKGFSHQRLEQLTIGGFGFQFPAFD